MSFKAYSDTGEIIIFPENASYKKVSKQIKSTLQSWKHYGTKSISLYSGEEKVKEYNVPKNIFQRKIVVIAPVLKVESLLRLLDEIEEYATRQMTHSNNYSSKVFQNH